MNFTYEAANMTRTENFIRENNFKNIYVPRIELKPTKRVLVMEFIDGVHIDKVEVMREMGIDTK